MLIFLSTALCAQDSTRKEQQHILDQLLMGLHAPADLKADVDTVYKLLKQNHPDLYAYISPGRLRKKIGRLKSGLRTPLTSLQFRSRLMAVLSQIGDGHIELMQDIAFLDALEPEDVDPYNEHDVCPIMQLRLKIIDNRLFLYKNYSTDTTIRPGAEILSVDDQPAAEFIRKLLSTYMASDGYNNTYKYQVLNNGQFCNAARIAFDFEDTVRYLILQDGKTQTHLITRRPATGLVVEDEDPSKNFDDGWFINGPGAPMILTVGRFAKRDQDQFYRSAFKAAAQQDVQNLVIDLRNNPGGNLDHLKKLYAFLIDTPSPVIRIKAHKFGPVLDSVMKTNAGYQYMYAHIDKPVMPADSFRFSGKIYVLINGASFSAAAILSAKLQQLKNVTLVGSETGGGGTGCTALLFQTMLLPYSRLTLRHGLFSVVIPGSLSKKGRGVMPDVKIPYRLSDYLDKKDVEMDWVFKQIGYSPQ